MLSPQKTKLLAHHNEMMRKMCHGSSESQLYRVLEGGMPTVRAGLHTYDTASVTAVSQPEAERCQLAGRHSRLS